MVVICDRDVCLFWGQSVVLFVGDVVGIGASRFRRKYLFWIVLSDSDRWDEAGNSRSRCAVGEPAVGSSCRCGGAGIDDGLLADYAVCEGCGELTIDRDRDDLRCY